MQEEKNNPRRYARDKPSDCAYCYFWKPKKKCCELLECYYLIPDKANGAKEAPKKSKTSTSEEPGNCKTCPYGRSSPCFGYCIKKILLEMNQKKQGRMEKQGILEEKGKQKEKGTLEEKERLKQKGEAVQSE